MGIAFCGAFALGTSCTKPVLENEKSMVEDSSEERLAVVTEFEPINGYLPSVACAECHNEIYQNFIETSHHVSAALASIDTVRGPLDQEENILRMPSPRFHYRVMSDADGLRQEEVRTINGEERLHRSHPFDVVIGSGKRGQTYLYWREDRLYQLPVSYFQGRGWMNSPGYPEDRSLWDRPIEPRCLECHITTVAMEGDPFGRDGKESWTFDRQKMIPEISCGSCHGPGAEHVAYHQANREDSEGKFLSRLSELSQARQVDNCALCHGGGGVSIRQTFTYRPGENLNRHLLRAENLNPDQIDVHGHHAALIASSSCYTGAEKLNCTTCHDPHRNQRGATTPSNQACIQCHMESHNDGTARGKVMPVELRTRCVDCHMPERPSASLKLKTPEGEDVEIFLRTHFISIYEDDSDAIMDLLKK